MKKIIIVIVSIIVLSSCQLAYEIQDEYTYDLIGDKSEIYYSTDFDVLGNNREICNYLFDNMTYREDFSGYDDVEKVLNRGHGDCKDYVRIYMNIVYVTTGVKCNLIGVKTRSVVEGGFPNHSVVELPDGTQIDPQTGMVVNYTVRYRYTHDELFK